MKKLLFLEIYPRENRGALVAALVIWSTFAVRVTGLMLRRVLAVGLGACAFAAFVPAALAFVLALILGGTAFVFWPRPAAKAA